MKNLSKLEKLAVLKFDLINIALSKTLNSESLVELRNNLILTDSLIKEGKINEKNIDNTALESVESYILSIRKGR